MASSPLEWRQTSTKERAPSHAKCSFLLLLQPHMPIWVLIQGTTPDFFFSTKKKRNRWSRQGWNGLRSVSFSRICTPVFLSLCHVTLFVCLFLVSLATLWYYCRLAGGLGDRLIKNEEKMEKICSFRVKRSLCQNCQNLILVARYPRS